jgi:transcriptional regulator with XRE-family HTH domain
MDAKLVAKYLSSLKEKTGLTYETIAEKSKRSESTVKNLCTGKTEDPRLDTVAPVVYAMGGSIDEMYNPNNSKDEVKAISIASIKEIYEQQLLELTKINEAHVNNIRTHYEQHRQDFKENVEKRLADKREIIEQQEKHIKTLKQENNIMKIFAVICLAILIGLLIAEVMNPSLGWLRY